MQWLMRDIQLLAVWFSFYGISPKAKNCWFWRMWYYQALFFMIVERIIEWRSFLLWRKIVKYYRQQSVSWDKNQLVLLHINKTFEKDFDLIQGDNEIVWRITGRKYYFQSLAKIKSDSVYKQACLVYVNWNISTQAHGIYLSHISLLFIDASLLKPICFWCAVFF